MSKDCMNIEGIGRSIIDLLVDQKMLNNFSDLYKLTEGNNRLTLHSLPGFGDKKIFEIEKQLKESKKKPLRRLLNALGMPGVGKKMSQEIDKAIKQKQTTEKRNKNSFSQIQKTMQDEEFLNNIYGVGQKIVIGIKDFWYNNKELLTQLHSQGLNFDSKNYSPKIATEGEWSGKHFGITGIFPLGRSDIIKTLEET